MSDSNQIIESMVGETDRTSESNYFEQRPEPLVLRIDYNSAQPAIIWNSGPGFEQLAKRIPSLFPNLEIVSAEKEHKVDSPRRERQSGVNLSGAEFGANSLPGRLGSDYIFPTVQELDFYKQKGIDLIRVPFLWERMQPGLLKKNSPDAAVDRSFDHTYVEQMDKFLSAAAERGMKVVLDAQQFGRFNKQVIGASNISNDDFKQFWSQMAKTFGHHSSIHGYDLSNEPHDEENKTWYAAAQAAVDGIRATGDKNTIFVEGNNWAGTQWWNENNGDISINDPANNLVYEAHSYWDKDHSGSYEGGPKASYEMAVAEARKKGFLAANEDPSNMGVNYARPFLDWLKKHNARGYIGEYGVPNDPAWVKVQDKFLAYTRENNIDVTAWGGGPWWGKDATLSLETGPKGEQSVNGPESLTLKSIEADLHESPLRR